MPVSVPTSGEVKETLPTRDAGGHEGAPREPLASCASVQTSSPTAVPGFRPVPSGRTTATFATCAWRIGVSRAGRPRRIENALGWSTCVVSVATSSAGVNGTASQPVAWKLAEPDAVGPAWGTTVTFVVAGVQRVGSVTKLAPFAAVPRRVRSRPVIWVGRPLKLLGSPSRVDVSPKSEPSRTWIGDCRRMLPSRPATGSTWMPSRAGSPALGSRL